MLPFPAFPRRLSLCLLLALLATSTGTPIRDASAQAGRLPERYRLEATWSADPQPRPAGDFTAAEGIAVAEDGTIYVADSGASTVHVLSPEGRPLRRFGAPGAGPGQLAGPLDLALAAGRAYVSDTGNGRVQVFDAASGAFLAAWPGLGAPGGIAAGADRVYVADAVLGRITVLDRAGLRLGAWGRGPGVAVELPLESPTGLALDAEGDLWVADPGRAAGSVLELSPAGEVLRSFDPMSEDLDRRPRDLAIDGDLPITVSAVDLVAYRRVFFTTLPSRIASQVGGRGVALGPGEGLVASVQDGQAVASGVHFYRDREGGRRSAAWLSLPVAPGRLDAPRRIARAGDGSVYLADRWPRIQRWSAAGSPEAQFRADALVDLARAPDGGVFRIESMGVARLAPDGLELWSWYEERPGSWFAAGAADGDRLYVADIGRGRLLRFEADGAGGPVAETVLDGLIVDLAAGGGQVLALDRGSEVLRLLDAGGVERGRWATVAKPTRLAAAPAGGAWFALAADGWLRKLAPDGSLRAAWDAAGAGRALDIEADDTGRVWALDGEGDLVRVFGPQAGEGEAPPDAAARCDLSPDKRAEPGRIWVGDPVTVTLTVSGDCPAGSVDLDVVLAIDQSGSMSGPKIAGARAAAVAFVAELDYRRAQAGIVLFAADARLAQPLGTDPGDLVRAIATARAGGGTDIASALRVARAELTSGRARSAALRAIVLMTDGLPDDEAAARREAELARQAGVEVFAIGLGGDVDLGLLQELAGDPGRTFAAPSEVELGRIFTRIARRLASTSLLDSVTITDTLPEDMRYVPGSAQPPAAWDPATRTLRWQLGPVPPAGLRLSYRVLPERAGRRPTNVQAQADYRDALGVAGRLLFPVPEVDVLGLRAAYLPIAFQRACPELRSDVVLVVDTSTSMDEGSASGGTKLEAARAAAQVFLGLLDLPRDRAALVGFNSEAQTVQGLTGDRAALARALDALPRGSGTRIDLGLRRALAELSSAGRPAGRLPVVVLLTDGRPSAGSEAEVAAAAAELRGEGVYVFTIGLGADADGGLLIAIAGDAARYSYAPDQRALAAIYQTIAWSLPCR